MIQIDTMGLAAFVTLFGHEWTSVASDRQGTKIIFDMSEEAFEEIKNAWRDEDGLRDYYNAVKRLQDAKFKARQQGGVHDNPRLLGLEEKNDAFAQ